jgi:hypothetical protein
MNFQELNEEETEDQSSISIYHTLLQSFIYLLILSILDMSSQMLGRVLRENLERRIREIEEQIEKYRQKYSMDFDEFFELVESNIGKLLDRGFDLGEVLEDSLVWEDLLDELDELKNKIKSLK